MSLNVGYDTVKMVHDSWDEVKKIPNCTQVAGELLFRNIFRIAPGAWAMFPFGQGYESAEDEMFQSPLFQKHAKNVVGMLDTAVHLLGPDLQILEEALVTLGASHVGYGVLPEHYPVVGQALIETLATALGEAFTPELKSAWAGVYGFVTDHMLKGANESLSRITIKVYGNKKKTVTLDECLAAMLPGQKELFYVTSEESFPALDRLHKAGVVVIKMGPKKAGMVVTNLQKYLGRKMINVAAAEEHGLLDLSFLDPPKPSDDSDSDSQASGQRSPSPKSVTKFFKHAGLDFNEAKDFCSWFQATLGPQRVLECTPTCQFASLPARVIPYQGMDIQSSLHRLSSDSSDDDFDCMPLPKKHVEINPAHEFIVQIHKIRRQYPEIAVMMAYQVHDNCLIQAGLMDDCRGMVNRMTDISMLLLKSKNGDE